MSPGRASADGVVTWQNHHTGRYLEVYKQSAVNGQHVGTWTGNGGTNQKWYDVRLSDGYWVEQTMLDRSKVLDRWGNGPCHLTIWDYWGGAQQRWREHKVAAGWWGLINKAGCEGDIYWDAASTYLDTSIYNVGLAGQRCVESTGDRNCHWK
ncbi:RICIN domain-containing protein [Spirillospora sp. CA-294931]|uniref:RICIN domain-containing protein n=1 Tax=Spirillospora sp. CA-294931 TaxID=3240042 RepID=UPI003D8DC50B